VIRLAKTKYGSAFYDSRSVFRVYRRSRLGFILKLFHVAVTDALTWEPVGGICTSMCV
jgi:hypothetical protein